MYTKHFLRNTVLLLNHIKILCESKLKLCIATDAHFAKVMCKSTRQIGRYLQYLRDTEQLVIYTSRLKSDKNTRKLFKERRIILGPRVDQKCFKYQRDITFVHFDKKIHGRERKTTNSLFLKCLPLPESPQNTYNPNPFFCKTHRPSRFVKLSLELLAVQDKMKEKREKKQKKITPFVRARKKKEKQREKELEALKLAKIIEEIAKSTIEPAKSTIEPAKSTIEMRPERTSLDQRASGGSTQRDTGRLSACPHCRPKGKVWRRRCICRTGSDSMSVSKFQSRNLFLPRTDNRPPIDQLERARKDIS